MHFTLNPSQSALPPTICCYFVLLRPNLNIVMLFWTVIVFFSAFDWTVDQLGAVNIYNQATRKLHDLAKKKTKLNDSDITLKAGIAIFTGTL